MRNCCAQLAVAVAGLAFLVGRAGIANAETVIVSVKSNFFSPTDVFVKTGDTVQWVWDQGVHTTTSTTGLWDSGILNPGSMFQYTFNNEGDFPYTCTLHFQCCNMAGTVHVSKPPRVHPSPVPEPAPAPYPLPPLSVVSLFDDMTLLLGSLAASRVSLMWLAHR